MNIYDDCKVYGPWINKTYGRRIVEIVYPNGTRECTTWARYQMERHLNRRLGRYETVDHIDRNKTNDSIDNLRVVDLSTHNSQDMFRVVYGNVACPICGTEFQIDRQQYYRVLYNHSAAAFCSRQCSGKYSFLVKSGKMQPIRNFTMSRLTYHVDKDKE